MQKAKKYLLALSILLLAVIALVEVFIPRVKRAFVKAPLNCGKTMQDYQSSKLQITFKYSDCIGLYQVAGNQEAIFLKDLRKKEDEQDILFISAETNSAGQVLNVSFKEAASYWRDYYMKSDSRGWADAGPTVEKEEEIGLGGKTGIKYTIGFMKRQDKVYWLYFPWNASVIRKVAYTSESQQQAEEILQTINFQ